MVILAYALKIVGVGFLLLAAIGVIRLPDAFTRMHAATKAGTLGAGLVVIGAAMSLEGGMAIAVAIATLIILLLSVPIASHLLGRAAYISGAPFWQRTVSDALSETLPRGEDLSAGDRSSAVLDVSRVLAAPSFDGECDATMTGAAIGRNASVPLTVVGLIDPAFVDDNPDDMRLCRVRLQQTLDRVASSLDVAPTVEMIEGDPAAALGALVRPDDVVVLPAAGWFNHGVGKEPEAMSGRGEALFPLARRLTVPVLIASAPLDIHKITVIDDGSERILDVLALIAKTRLFGDVSVSVTWAASAEPQPVRRKALEEAGAPLTVGFSAAKSADGIVSNPGEVVVSASLPSGRADWYGLDWRDRVAPDWRGHYLLV